ncbi:MAG: Ig-like domain-containing protein [Elusimicrobiales bacterium]|jgi:hypothetical protein
MTENNRRERHFGKKAFFRGAPAAAAWLVFCQAFAYCAVKPNVMILLDSSDSMGSQTRGHVQALPDYRRTTTYGTCPEASYSTDMVYQYEAGSYVEYAADIPSVSSAPARTALSARGFWFGNIGSFSVQLFHGNYLNYEFCTGLVDRTKISIAKSVIANVVSDISEKSFGVMKFNSSNDGADMVAEIGTSTTAIVTAVNAVNTGGYTPLGPQLRDAGYYFDGSFQGYPSPIQDACQQNSVFIISDGAENRWGSPHTEIIPQAALEYTRDHSTVYDGTQNLIVNTISFYLNSAVDTPAISSLTAAAYYGGGSYIAANNPAQLMQAFFQIPPGIALTAPLPNSIVSGNVLLSVGDGNAGCLQSVQFKVDGNNRGAPKTSPPYNYIWNSNDVLNGTHTVTAVMLDKSGNSSISFPALVTTSNDQTPPVISNVNWTTWYTSATVTWQTNEPADTQVEYGTSTAYDMQTPYGAALVAVHGETITGLTPGIRYHSKVKSMDASGNLTVQGDYQFDTTGMSSPGELDHLKLTFGNAGLPGPGVKTGNYPYALTAGDCYGLTIEAVDNQNRHFNLTEDVAVRQFGLDGSGLETELIPGIALRDNYRLGISTMVFPMINGFVFLGSETDINKQICFYNATQAPGNYKRPGDPGDIHLRAVQVSSPGITGFSSSFIVWPGYANGLALLAPDVTLAPATPAGVTGSLTGQQQGTPFLVHAYLVDRYFNSTRTNTDTLRFAASPADKTGFLPFEGPVVDGLLVSSVTVDACGVSASLSVQDLTSPSIGNGAVTVSMAACGAGPAGAGFYQVAVPGLVRAGDPFPVAVTVKNVSVPAGFGSVRYVGRFIPLVPLDVAHFTYASGVFGLPAFEFSIPDGYSGDYTYTLNNQTYNRNEVVWLQLVGEAPAELKGSTALGGPMQVLPGSPERLAASVSPNTIGPLSSAVITAKLTDRYGNGIPNLAVSAQVTQGTGDFNVGGVPGKLTTVQTGLNGEVAIPFISHRLSETDKVRVWAPGNPGLPMVELTVSITLIGDKTVAAYPNPTKITERPVTIEYRLDYDSEVEITIYTSLGRKVWRKQIAAGAPGGLAGYNTVEWNGRNGAGEMAAVGVYGLHLRISANGHTSEAKTRLGLIK